MHVTKGAARRGVGLLVLLLVAAWILARVVEGDGSATVADSHEHLLPGQRVLSVEPSSPEAPSLPPLLVGVAEGSIPPAGATRTPTSASPGGDAAPGPGMVQPGMVQPGSLIPGSVIPGSVIPGSGGPGSVGPGSIGTAPDWGPLAPSVSDPPDGSPGSENAGGEKPDGTHRGGTVAPATPREPTRSNGTGPSAPGPAPQATPQGTEPKSATYAPTYSSSTTYFGTALSGSDGSIPEALAANDRLFGKLGVVRQFDPTVPPEGAWSRRTVLNDRVISTSFREPPSAILAGRHDDQLLAYFRQAPTRKPIFWTYFHEPEPHIDRGEFTHSEYRQAWRHVVRLAAQARKPNLYPTLILTGWTADPASRRDWRSYYPGDDYISVVAWDPYNSATKRPTSYREPTQLFAHVLRASHSSGKPWAIAETGTMKVSGDDGAGRAAWLTKTGRYFEREGAAFVTYFQSTRDGDFKLTDKPSVAAWSEFVRRTSP